MKKRRLLDVQIGARVAFMEVEDGLRFCVRQTMRRRSPFRPLRQLTFRAVNAVKLAIHLAHGTDYDSRQIAGVAPKMRDIVWSDLPNSSQINPAILDQI